jgi:hypothetical protein
MELLGKEESWRIEAKEKERNMEAYKNDCSTTLSVAGILVYSMER